MGLTPNTLTHNARNIGNEALDLRWLAHGEFVDLVLEASIEELGRERGGEFGELF